MAAIRVFDTARGIVEKRADIVRPAVLGAIYGVSEGPLWRY